MKNNRPMKDLLATKYIPYNKYVAVELGPLACIMLGELVYEYDYYKGEGRLRKDGSFYSSINNIQEATGLKRKNQEAAIAILENAGILTKTFDKAEGNKRFFKLNMCKISEYTKYNSEAQNDTPLCPTSTYPYVPVVHTLCPSSTYPMSSEDIAMSHEYNHKEIIYNKEYIINNKNNNIGAQKKICSPASCQPTADTELGQPTAKPKRKTKKQQRYDEVTSSTEFNTTVLDGITNETEKEEIKALWNEYVELRCSKDYRAFTDGAIRRNLKVLEGTTFPERKAILDKSVTKGRTGLFPLNDYDKERIKGDLTRTEGSDERLIEKIFQSSCREREDELPEGTTHNLLMDLCKEYGEERIKLLYYEKVKPSVDARYNIKRDWIR